MLITNPQLAKCIALLVDLANLAWDYRRKYTPEGFLLTLSPGWNPQSCSYWCLALSHSYRWQHLVEYGTQKSKGNQPLAPSKAHLPINHANPNTHQHPTVSLQGPPPQACGAAPPQSSTGIAKLKPNRPEGWLRYQAALVTSHLPKVPGEAMLLGVEQVYGL
ncbi:hypothetical protein PCASD_16143 [Puccinia coronata f. sp. avenae]|uniref:Uncharacterized protein n=1 Tax=Puccinia coronata f. sp. avenae TaxID=200324 RepID=A0A2N5TAK7_9BASI|nr:hypothetical protein PCASD_16143 [Puccinia coronata f. sp. avenae]